MGSIRACCHEDTSAVLSFLVLTSVTSPGECKLLSQMLGGVIGVIRPGSGAQARIKVGAFSHLVMALFAHVVPDLDNYIRR